MIVLRSFFAIKQVLHAIHLSSTYGRTLGTSSTKEALKEVEKKTVSVLLALELAKDHVTAIIPMPYRVEVLENIFTLLFLKKENKDPYSNEKNPPDGSLDNPPGTPRESFLATEQVRFLLL